MRAASPRSLSPRRLATSVVRGVLVHRCGIGGCKIHGSIVVVYARYVADGDRHAYGCRDGRPSWQAHNTAIGGGTVATEARGQGYAVVRSGVLNRLARVKFGDRPIRSGGQGQDRCVGSI